MNLMKRLFKSMSLSIGLVVVVVVRTILKPIKLLDKGLQLSALWMLSQYR